MLKFDKIIRRLTLGEKVELLVSSKKYVNNRLDDFALPIFRIKEANLNDYNASWDTDLIYELAKRNALVKDSDEDSITITGCSTQNITEYQANASSNSKYLNGKCAAAFIKGVNAAKMPSAILGIEGYAPMDEELRREELLASEVAIKEGCPSVIVADSSNNLEIIKDEYGYKGEMMLNSSEAARGLYSGCHFIFNEENPRKNLLEKIEAYNEAIMSLNKKELTRVDIDQMEREGLIFNPNRLDEILDSYFEFLYNLDMDNNKENTEAYNVDALNNISKESIIMLENSGVLPLSKKDEVFICGDIAFKGGSESFISLAQASDLNTTIAAHGYSDDLENDRDLLDEALNMAKDSTYVLAFVSLKDREIRNNQIRMIKALNQSNKKVITVVIGSGEILNEDLFDASEAVIQVNIKTAESLKSLIKIVLGEETPAGRTAWINGYDGIVADLNDSSTYRHPLGYGLSYTSFEYNRMTVDKHGVSFTVRNSGIYDGYELATLYVTMETEDSPIKKNLRGFKKIYLKSNESTRVFIDFDEFTFKSYNESNKCDEIKTGTYLLTIESMYNDIKLHTTIDLKGKLLNPVTFENEIVESKDDIDVVLNKFRDTSDRRDFFNEKKTIKFRTKMILMTILFLYFNITFALIGINYIDLNSLPNLIVFSIIVLAFNIASITGTILMIKNKSKVKEIPSPRPIRESEIDRLVGNMASYKELAKVTYPKPVEAPTEEIPEEEIEVALEELPEDEEKEKTSYLDSDFDCSEDTIDFAADIYPAEYVQTYNDYSANNGVIIEPKSSRALFSCLASSRLLILNSGAKVELDKTVDLILSYLGNGHNVFDLSKAKSLNDLLWEKIDEGTYKRTELSGLISNMRKLKNTCNVIAFKNPDMSNLRNTLGVLLDYVIYPNLDHYINLGTKDEEDLVLIPKNLLIILVPSDNTYLDSFDREIAERSYSMELLLRDNELEPINDVVVKYMSYPALERMAKECKERNIIPEEYWKKLDDLEEEINNLESFRFENKTILDFERFVGLMIEAGGDIDEAIDMVLAYRIVPILKGYNVYKNNDGDNTLYEIISRIFTEENTELTKRAIKKRLD